MSRIKDYIRSLEEEIETCNMLEYQLYSYEMKEKYGEVEDLLDFFTPLMEEE